MSNNVTQDMREVIAFIDANKPQPGASRARQAIARVAEYIRRVRIAANGSEVYEENKS